MTGKGGNRYVEKRRTIGNEEMDNGQEKPLDCIVFKNQFSVDLIELFK